MLKIGYHEKLSLGYKGLIKEAISVGANTFAFFTRNPLASTPPKIDPSALKEFKKELEASSFFPLVAHAPYIMNPASVKEDLREHTRRLVFEDIRLLSYLPKCYYNFHPGSHMGAGVEVGCERVSSMLISVISEGIKENLLGNTTILIETMSGKGGELGRNFLEIATIIKSVEEALGQDLTSILGVCLDTCHIFDAGYDIVNALPLVMKEFNDTIGLNRLYAIHLNDSKNALSSHKDRHEKLGEGCIGFDALVNIVNSPELKDKVFILETPNEHDGYKKEIERIKAAYKQED